LAEPAWVTSGRKAGRPLTEECPWLATDLVLEEFDPARPADAYVMAQEAGFAAEHAAALAARAPVIDLSADFRFADRAVYQSVYGRENTSPAQSVYGLPELVSREAIGTARVVGNPGCYPTATLLALLPLVRAGVVAGTPVIDAKSGASGAGRARNETPYLFNELAEGLSAYGVIGHRHTAEIEQLVERPVRFTPHLVPMTRGLLASVHVPLSHPMPEVATLFTETYRSEPLVRVVSVPPSTKQVRGSDRADLWAGYDERTQMAVVICVIDNLGKGAAGQAVQNLNLVMGWPELSGLIREGVWP
jgi:N-acetyl-gamma-glutamyl-phosphate reductase